MLVEEEEGAWRGGKQLGRGWGEEGRLAHGNRRKGAGACVGTGKEDCLVSAVLGEREEDPQEDCLPPVWWSSPKTGQRISPPLPQALTVTCFGDTSLPEKVVQAQKERRPCQTLGAHRLAPFLSPLGFNLLQAAAPIDTYTKYEAGGLPWDLPPNWDSNDRCPVPRPTPATPSQPYSLPSPNSPIGENRRSCRGGEKLLEPNCQEPEQDRGTDSWDLKGYSG